MVFTGTRADFGLLRPVIEHLVGHPRFEVIVVVGGSHFSDAHGRTVDEIVDAGIPIGWKIELDMSVDSDTHIARATSETMAAVATAIKATSPMWVSYSATDSKRWHSPRRAS